MQLEDLPIIPVRTTVALTDKVVVTNGGSNIPVTITVGNLLASAIGALPTTNPAVAGALWRNNGVVTVSAG